MEVKEIREKLMKDGTVFTVEGIVNYDKTPQEFVSSHTVFDSGHDLHSISINEVFGKRMGVNKFGPTCVTLYSFDMLDNKTVGKIKYSNVTIVK